jgi:uncharacterized protein YjbI with pentapeptide repeats
MMDDFWSDRLEPGTDHDPALPGLSWRAMSHLVEHQRWLNSAGQLGKRLELHPKAWGKNVKTDLFEANLRGVDLSRASLSHVVFASCSLRLARFVGSELRDVRFICCELQGCDFNGAILENVSFERGTNYQQARFDGCDTRQMHCEGPSLPVSRASLISPKP